MTDTTMLIIGLSVIAAAAVAGYAIAEWWSN